MMSSRQQRQLIEAAFIPRVCKCTIMSNGVVTIQLSDPISDAVLLEVRDVRAGDLMNWAAIDRFAADLQRNLPAGAQGNRNAGSN